MTVGSQMNSITGAIRQELPESFAPRIRTILLNLTLFINTLVSATIDQSAPNLVKIYFTNGSQMSAILCLIGLEQPELFALELEKNTAFDFVYTLASYKIYMTRTTAYCKTIVTTIFKNFQKQKCFQTLIIYRF